MTKFKKLLASLTAFVMAVGLMIGGSVPVKADDTTKTINSDDGGSATITISNATKGATYSVYRVFDATNDGTNNNISYRVISSKASTTLPNGFVTDEAGNVIHGTKDSTSGQITENKATDLTAAEINAIAQYVKDDTVVTSGSITSTETQTNLEFTGLKYGYYYITSTVGSVISVTSTNPNGQVTDKNETPTVEKKITAIDDGNGTNAASKGSVSASGKSSIAEVGSTVHFEARINVRKGAQNYKFRDNMYNQPLAFKKDSISVVYLAKNSANEVSLTGGTDYTLNTTADTSGEHPYTFKIDFDKTSDKANAALTDGATIIIRYSATVISDALQTSTAAAKNSATVSYGTDPQQFSEPSSTDTYNGKITINKTFVDDNSKEVGKKAGAGFVLRKGAGTTADPYLYYKETTDANGKITGLTWVSDLTGENAATEKVTTDANTTLTFSGLQDGTYTIIENTVPAGYNKAADQQIRIYEATATTIDGENKNPFDPQNLNRSVDIQNRQGSVLPSTGGIGTTLFYVAGGAIIICAAVLLIARRKRNA